MGLEEVVLYRDSGHTSTASRIYQQISRIGFSNDYLEALCRLLAEFNETKKSLSILVEGELTLKIKPIFDASVDAWVYFANFCGVPIRLFSRKEGTEIDSRYVLDRDSLKVFYTRDMEPCVKEVALDGGFFIMPKNLTKKYFNNFGGVAIRKVDSTGQISVSNNPRNVRAKYSGNYVVVVFKEGKEFLFDIYGNMARSRLSVIDENKRRRLDRARNIPEEARSYKPDMGELKEELFRIWGENLSVFSHYGVCGIVKGSFLKPMSKRRSEVCFPHYVRGREGKERTRRKEISPTFYINEFYRESSVQVETSGPYVILYNPGTYRHNNGSENAHKVDTKMLITPVRAGNNDANMMMVRDMGSSRYITIRFGARKFVFNRSSLENLIEGNSIERAGIFIHQYPVDCYDVSLVLKKEDEFEEIPIQPQKVTITN